MIDRAAFNQGEHAQYPPHVEQTQLMDSLMARGPHAVMLKVRGGADTYIKQDGSVGTAGKGALSSDEVSFTIAATQDQTLFQHDTTHYVVRRLTPTECERLQGFPDGWTDIEDWVDTKGKLRKASDGARYKALGNSFAVPVVRWIGERIQMVSKLEEE